MPLAAGFGLLDTLTFPELITILVVGLVVLGPDKLPGMARQAGEWMAKLRAMSSNLQREVSSVLDEPEMQSLKELGEFAARPRAKLAEYARNATTLDPDDHTDGDAPASSPPTLKPVATGHDHPMEVAAREAADAATAAEVAALEAEAGAPEPETAAPEPVVASEPATGPVFDEPNEADLIDGPREPIAFGEPVVVAPLHPEAERSGDLT
jgi:sec-independent protein translocase protein TatB